MRWHALILAAGRGPSDPMAAAYGVSHKCLVEVGGIPMLRRVVETLLAHPAIAGIPRLRLPGYFADCGSPSYPLAIRLLSDELRQKR